MSTYIYGIRSKDNPEYQKHVKVLEACREADIEKLPQETANYFQCENPRDAEIESPLVVKVPKTEYREDMTEGYEIKVSDIPEGVEVIRFCNTW